MTNTKSLRVEKKGRVFVGGQYDFMPTLRKIAEFVNEASFGDQTFNPVIPYDDPSIQVHETMEQDLSILETCEFAIFDLSDLGAQLVEMQYAKNQSIPSLIVYPVRQRKNEPERGKRTVLSFDIDHFGYLTFEELRTVIWRFLLGSGVARDYPHRSVSDLKLDRSIRHIKALGRREEYAKAKRLVEELLKEFPQSLELLLEEAFIAFRENNNALQGSLKKADDLFAALEKPEDQAEVLYNRALIHTETEKYEEAVSALETANTLRPNDGRILTLWGFGKWTLGATKGDPSLKKEAIAVTKRVVDGSETAAGPIQIPDPLVAITAINNLAAFYLDEFEDTKPDGKDPEVLDRLQKTLAITEHLESWHKAFRRRRSNWLDTRGFARLASRSYGEQGFGTEG